MTDLSGLFRDISQKPSAPIDMKALVAEIAVISASVPRDEWRKLPADFASNHDLYIYGARKSK